MNENQTQNEALIAAIKKLMGSTSPEDVKVLNSINNMLSVTAVFAALRSAESSIKDSAESVAETEGAESNNTYNPEHQPESSSSTAESNHNYQSQRAMDRKIPEIDIDEDEIPF